MKTMKKLILCALTGISLLFLTNMYKSSASKYDETFTESSIGVSVRFGEPDWSGGDYCTFPDMTVSSQNQNAISTIQISYSGDDTSNVNITAPSTDGFSASTDNTNTSAIYTTTKTVNDVQNFLRSVKYNCSSSQSISILLSSTPIPNDTHYFPGTGHFYKYVSESLSWLDAYKKALSSEIGGWKGYLAVITSAEENDFYYKYTNSENAWLGGTRFALSNMGSDSIATSSTNMGYYYWACGPESCFKPKDPLWVSSGLISKNNIPEGTYGTPDPTNSIFLDKIGYDEPTSDVHITYSYNKSYSPSGGDEGYLMHYGNGAWNDCPIRHSIMQGYTIEYGDRLWGNSTPLKDSITASTDIGKPVTIKYHYNHDSNPNKVDTGNAYYNMALSETMDNLPTPSPIPTDYTFNGWYTAATGGTKAELTSNAANLLGGTYKSELDLYAQWHIDPDTTKPQITSTTLTHEKYGVETNYTGGLTKSPVTVTYTVADSYASGAITSGIDADSYQISLDGGNSYSKAIDIIDGVEVLSRTEGELKLKISKEGESNLKIKVADKSGNISESSSVNLKIDMTPPAPVKITSPEGDTWLKTKTPTISGTGEKGCTVHIKEGDTILGSPEVKEDGTWQLTLDPLAEWIHRLTITQTDPAGQTSNPAKINFIINTEGFAGKIVITDDARVYWIRPGDKSVFKFLH